MRLNTKWRKWSVSEVESEKSNFHIQQTNKPNLGDDYSSPKEPPKDETRKRKPEFKKSKLKEPREKKDVKKGIQEVKEIPFYDMPQDTKDRIYDTDFPNMLDWSRESGLDRGMVKIANDMNDIVSLNGNRIKRLGNAVSIMISKFAEDQCGTDIFPGNEFWDEDALLNRVMTKVPIHICRKDRELEKVILILDTSPSCSEQAMMYANIARAVIGHGLVEMYDAPNAYITRKFCPVKKKFVEFMDAETILEQKIARWKHFHNRHIIFFGDTDGWRIVRESMENNTIHWFMNIRGDELDDWLGTAKLESLKLLPSQARKRIINNIFTTDDFINAIKRLK